MGIEKLQSELNTLFPQAKIIAFERGDADPSAGDIVIATQAILRFKDRLKPQVIALVDLDSPRVENPLSSEENGRNLTTSSIDLEQQEESQVALFQENAFC